MDNIYFFEIILIMYVINNDNLIMLFKIFMVQNEK